jgi:pSer/pThr/pTyr-binding forkhead associated (FHA) protein
MAGDQNPKSAGSSVSKPGARTSPVLVPQGVLANQPEVPLDRPVTTVGSNDNARLHLVSRTVSKGHAIFVNSGGVTYVADLASRTGVLVNGKLIRDVDLKNGDRVQIGKFVFRYRSAPNLGPAAPAQVVPPAAVIVVGSPAKPITSRVFQIGRRENGDINFPSDAGVSASHAVIFEMDGRWYIRDLGSRTGTTVNGKPIHQQKLSFGDRIVIGSATILFQPGVVEVDEFAEHAASPATKPAVDESFAFEPQPVARARESTAQTPLASAADDAIPLADELPLRAGDWKSAFPVSTPEPESVPVEPETIEEAPAAEPLGSVLPQQPTTPELVDDVQPIEQPLAVEPEPIAVEEEPAPVAEVHHEIETPTEAIEPIAVEEQPAPVAEVHHEIEIPAEALEPIAIEEESAPVAGVHREIQIPSEAVEPIAIEPAPLPVDEIAEPVSEVAEDLSPLAGATEPSGSAAGMVAAAGIVPADLVTPVEDFVFVPGKEIADPNALPDLIFWGDPELDSVAEQAVVTAKPAESSPPPMAAAAPPTAAPVEELVAADVTAEPFEAANFAAELEAARDILHTQSSESATTEITVDPVEQPPEITPATGDHGECVEEFALVSSDAAQPIASPSPEITMPEASVESAQEIAPSAAIEPGDEVSHTSSSETITSEITVDSVEQPADVTGSPIDENPFIEQAATIASDAVEEMPPGPPVVALPEASAGTVEEFAAHAPPENAETTVDVIEHAEPPSIPMVEDIAPAPLLEVATSETVMDELTPLAIEPGGASLVSEPHELDAGEIFVDSVQEPEQPQLAESIVEEDPPDTADDLTLSAVDEQPLDPLSDSFPLVEAAEELPWPKDLAAFAEATVATAGIYGATTAAAALPEADLSAAAVAEEVGSEPDPQPIAKFIDAAPDTVVVEEAHSAISGSVDDLDDFEFLHPEEHEPIATVAAAAGEISAVSTVDEIPTGEHTTVTEATVAEIPPSVDIHEELPDLPREVVDETAAKTDAVSLPTADNGQLTTDITDADLELLDFGDHPDDADEHPSGFEEISGISTVDELPATDRSTVTPSQSPPVAPTNESDLDFSDDPPAAAPPPQSPDDGDGARHGPSIFGIQFEGGSFLGGMPISLASKPPATPPPSRSPVFDARSTAPSGLSNATVAKVAPEPPKAPQRPTTPPRPTISQPTAPAAPTSLSGLISDAHAPWAAPPVIPPTSREPATVAKPGAGPKRALSSNFTVPGTTPRTAEVFSQMAAPIGVEVFGGRPGDPNQFTVPDSKETAAEKAAADAEETAAATKAGAAVLPPVRKQRRSRLPWLLVLAVLIPAGLAGAIYKLVPVSVQVVGSISFDNLAAQQADDAHAFREDQAKNRLRSDQVRQGAVAILEKQGVPLGFLADEEMYTDVVDSQYLNWAGQKLEFTYNNTNEPVGTAQVNAIMTSLMQRDRDLDAARNLARAEAAAAKAAVDDAAARVASIKQQRREQQDKAQDYPDASIVALADQDAAKLQQEWTDAKTVRENSEKALAELRSEDPAKPIDIEADPKVVDLKKQLQPLLDQIAKLRGAGAIDSGSKALIGTDVSVGATTQPDANADPLLLPLQQQVDALNAKLTQRREDLATEAAVGPEQRAVNLARAVEDLSVKITNLAKVENDAKAAYDQAAAKANEDHARITAAHLAGIKGQELEQLEVDTEAELVRARNTEDEKEAALARCVTLAGSPQVVTRSKTDMRPKLSIGGSVFIWAVLAMMIAGELRRPRLMTKGATPAAVPLVNPPPARAIPWPQPKQLQGLENGGVEQPQVVAEADQVFGV